MLIRPEPATFDCTRLAIVLCSLFDFEQPKQHASDIAPAVVDPGRALSLCSPPEHVVFVERK